MRRTPVGAAGAQQSRRRGRVLDIFDNSVWRLSGMPGHARPGRERVKATQVSWLGISVLIVLVWPATRAAEATTVPATP